MTLPWGVPDLEGGGGGTGQRGPQGPPGPPGAYYAEIYTTAATAPATPTGGAVSGGRVTAAPTGWSLTVPATVPQGEELYVSVALVANDTAAAAWSAPYVGGGTGPAGKDGRDGRPVGLRLTADRDARHALAPLGDTTGDSVLSGQLVYQGDTHDLWQFTGRNQDGTAQWTHRGSIFTPQQQSRLVPTFSDANDGQVLTVVDAGAFGVQVGWEDASGGGSADLSGYEIQAFTFYNNDTDLRDAWDALEFGDTLSYNIGNGGSLNSFPILGTARDGSVFTLYLEKSVDVLEWFDNVSSPDDLWLRDSERVYFLTSSDTPRGTVDDVDSSGDWHLESAPGAPQVILDAIEVAAASGSGGGGGGTAVAAHTPAAGDAELAGLDIAGTDYELVDREGRDRLHAVEQRVQPIREVPQTWANVADAGTAGWTAAAGLLTSVNAIAALTFGNGDVSGTVAQFVYVRIPVAAQQSVYRFRYTIGGGSRNGQIHDRVLGTWSGERVGADATWAYYRVAFFEGDTFSAGRTQLGTGTFEWEGALTEGSVDDELDALGVNQQIDALKNVTRDLHLDGATRLVKSTAATTAGIARVAIQNSALQAIEAGTQSLDVQGVVFTATLARAHFGTTAATTDEPVIRLSGTQARSDWRVLFDDAAFLAGGWVPINVTNGAAGYDYYISGKVSRTTEVALYKSTIETTFHGAFAEGLAVAPVTAGGGAALTGVWRGTQAQYDAIASPDANVLYLIEGGS